MTLGRSSLPVLVLVLALAAAACSGSSRPEEDATSSSSSSGGSQQWIPVPGGTSGSSSWGKDDFQPVSIKVPQPSTGTAPGNDEGDWYGGGSSSSSGGPWGDPPPADPYWRSPLANDLVMPEIAPVCAARDAAKGSYVMTPAEPQLPEGHRISITRDLTEHRYGDGVYRSGFTLLFRSAPDKLATDDHGAMRIESLAWLNIHLDSVESHPEAFAVGQTQEVAIGWGTGDSIYACAEDGISTDWANGESLPLEKATVTLTRRDATGIAGTLELPGRGETLTFDAPFGESFPGEDGICCLR